MSGEVTACGLCGSAQLQVILDMGRQPVAERMDCGDAYPLALLRCWDCMLVQLSYQVPQEVLFPPGHPYTTGTTRALREHFGALAAELTAGLPDGAVVVDIGANDGTLLGAMRPELTRIAVEPTDQYLKCAERGLGTWNGFFTLDVARDILAAHDPATLVTATNVLAHVPDPHDFMEGVEYLLAEDGVFVTENGYLGAITDGLQFDSVYHEHLRYWSAESLTRLIGMHGFQVESVTQVPVHGGSFRTVARKRHVGDLEPRASAAAGRLRELLASLEGPVYGIGAATRAVPLIHYARIASYLAAVCEVDGSEKTGHTMPGTSIPIVPDAQFLTAQPPYALVFPWHLAPELAAKYRRAGYRGRFIVPLPEPRILDA